VIYFGAMLAYASEIARIQTLMTEIRQIRTGPKSSWQAGYVGQSQG
jgi:hypothetical protein